MNARTFTILSGAGLLALSATAPATFAQETESRVIVRSLSHGDADEHHSVAVTIDNGKITVILDGQEIPEDRIKREDGRIIILDENGKAIENLGVFVDGGTHAYTSGEWGARAMPGFTMVTDGAHAPVMLGLTMSRPSPALAYHLGLDEREGTMITGVYEGLPAHKAGLREFDLIVEIEGDGPADGEAIRAALEGLEGGDRLELTVIAKGRRKTVDLRVADYDADAMRQAEYLGSGAHGMGGFRIWAPGMTPGDGTRDFFVAPDGDEWFKFIPDMDEIRDRLKDSMGDLDLDDDAHGRLDGIKSRMSDIERMLDRLLNQVDKSRRDNRDRAPDQDRD